MRLQEEQTLFHFTKQTFRRLDNKVGKLQCFCTDVTVLSEYAVTVVIERKINLDHVLWPLLIEEKTDFES